MINEMMGMLRKSSCQKIWTSARWYVDKYRDKKKSKTKTWGNDELPGSLKMTAELFSALLLYYLRASALVGRSV
jgi:hypothetical protein